MTSSLIRFVVLVLLMALILPWTPWWVVFIIPLIVAFGFDHSVSKAALVSFLAAFIIWFAVNFYSGYANDHFLAVAIGKIFNGLSYTLLYVVSGFLGGIYGGLGGFFGQSLKNYALTKQSNT